MSLNKLIESVKAITCDEDLYALVKEFNLVDEPRNDPKSQILGLYTGTIEEKNITLTHTWYDRCRTFQINPDGNVVTLEVDGVKQAEGRFLDKQ